MGATCPIQACMQIKHRIKAHSGTIQHSHWWKTWLFTSGFGNWADDSFFWWVNKTDSGLQLRERWQAQTKVILQNTHRCITVSSPEYQTSSQATKISTWGFFEAKCDSPYVKKVVPGILKSSTTETRWLMSETPQHQSHMSVSCNMWDDSRYMKAHVGRLGYITPSQVL